MIKGDIVLGDTYCTIYVGYQASEHEHGGYVIDVISYLSMVIGGIDINIPPWQKDHIEDMIEEDIKREAQKDIARQVAHYNELKALGDAGL